MELLRFGHIGLSSAEEGLVATLFRLHGIDQSFIWTLASAPPFDALLVDAQCEESAFLHLKGTQTRVMRLEAHGAAPEGHMPRPIRSDTLLNWLNSIELGLLHSPGDAFASTAIQSQLEHSVPPQFHEAAAPAKVAPAAVAPAVPEPPPEWTSRKDSTEYRLRRWPPASLLNKDVAKVRVATMVSRRAMSLGEVSELSRIPAQRCEEFLLEWARHGLLQMHQRPDIPVQRIGHPSGDGAGPDPAPRGGFGASLIHSIRKRFGIL
jgi:hypothetical protein